MVSRKAKKRGWFGRLVGWALRFFFLFALLSVAWVLAYRFLNPPITFTMMSDLLAGRGVTREWMPLARIDADMKRAAIAAEDSRFCSHHGFDQDAIAAAMRRNAEGRGVIRGGSTISQQTAKNAFLWQGGGYLRKGLEAWFTLLIEAMWPKARIMEVYLNIAETGIGTYGVEAGARRYFGKGASSLSRTEAARIAAVLPLPKQRDAISPTGFTRRYGNSISARIPVVARDRLDACLGGAAAAPERDEAEERPAAKRRTPKATPAPPPAETAEDYLDAPDIGAPVEPQLAPAEPEPLAETPPEADAPVEINGL